MTILAVDFGEKRIGLAVSDAAERVALPLRTVRRSSDAAAAREIARLAHERGATLLIVGDPVNVDGSRGAASERVRRFARRLAAAAGHPLELVAETLTTVEAEERLRQAGIDPARRPAKRDAVAAQILLEEALARPRRNAAAPGDLPAPRSGAGR